MGGRCYAPHKSGSTILCAAKADRARRWGGSPHTHSCEAEPAGRVEPSGRGGGGPGKPRAAVRGDMWRGHGGGDGAVLGGRGAHIVAQKREKKIVPVLASKREHTRLSKSALATATRLTMPCHKCSPNRVQAHTLRLFSPKHSVTPLPPCQSELDSPRLPPASAARLLWTSSAAPRGREGVCPGREVARPRTANPV